LRPPGLDDNFGVMASQTELRSSTFKLKSAILFAGSQQPWESLHSGFTPEPPIPSMMCVHELRFLHYIAKHHYTASGAIVDFGPLVGSSTYAFASGMSRGRIFSYDLWRVWHGLEALYTDGTQLAFGDDLMPFFLKNTAPFSAMIIPRKGSIMNFGWSEGPIEIMLIDAAKKPAIMRHIANEFFPHLMPGAIVIQQDYVAAECPWLHICMVQMKEYFELIDSPEGGSVCFRVVKPIPQNVLPEAYWMGPDVRDCMAEARSVLTEWRALCMWLAEARYELICGHADRAAEILQLVQAHPDFNPHLDYDVKFIEYFISHNERGIPGFEFD
jgi:hypothetical protein